jgi:hypothetical protein
MPSVFDGQIGDRVLDQALLHRVGIEERRQVSDPEAGDRGIQSDWPSFTVSQPAVRTCRFSPEGAVIFQTLPEAWLE